MKARTKSNIHWGLGGLVGFIFMGSAMSKFLGAPEAIQMAEGIGLTIDTFKILGIIELTSAILFLIPRTGILGTLLLGAYMGGAIAVHLTHGLSVMAPSFIEAIIWTVAVVRFPELRNRLFNNQ